MKHPILMLYGENNNNMGKIVPQCVGSPVCTLLCCSNSPSWASCL